MELLETEVADDRTMAGVVPFISPFKFSETCRAYVCLVLGHGRINHPSCINVFFTNKLSLYNNVVAGPDIPFRVGGGGGGRAHVVLKGEN